VLLRAIYYAFVLLALLGDARIFLFVANRYVFASRREEENIYSKLIWFMPPLLLALTALLWPLSMWIERLLTMQWFDRVVPDRIEDLAWSILIAKIGAGWLIIAASAGIFWIVDRIRVLSMHALPLDGVRTLESTITPFDLEITRHEVFIDALPPELDGYLSAFLSDTHVIPSRRDYFRDVVAQTRNLDPDLILLGGDLVTWRRHIAVMSELLLDGLTARDGVYAVLGNHDYWSGAEQVIAALKAKGIEMLTNRGIDIRRGDARLTVAGIDEAYRGTPDVDSALRAAARVRIAVSHHPDIIDQLENHRIDLLVCGHTHGGQIRLPFFGALFVPSIHEGMYVSGFHRVRDVLMYVGRGIGGVPPVRVLCKAELPLFVLRRPHFTSTSK